MASSFLLHNLCSLSSHSSIRRRNPTLSPTHTQFFSIGKLRTQRSRFSPVVFAAQNDFLKVIQTVWKVGKDGVEAGTNLVPDAIPRPVARLSVTVVALSVALFLFKSVLSTIFFVLAMMGAIYFIFIALNKDEGPRGGGGTSPTSTEETLEEARRIMEKYK